MPVQSVTPILNVSSVIESILWFEKLGWTRGFTWPPNSHDVNFGSVCSGRAEIFLCRGAQGSKGTIMPKEPGDDQTDGVWMSWWVDNMAEVDVVHARADELGLTITMPPTDQPWGLREFHLRHPDGHMFRVGSGVESG